MTQSRSIRIIFCTSMLSVLLSSTSMSSSAFTTTPSTPSIPTFLNQQAQLLLKTQKRNGILLYNNLNNNNKVDHSTRFTLYAESNNHNHNHNNDNDDKKRSFTFYSRKTQKLIKTSTKLILPALFFTLSPPQTTTIQPANAVLGKIPTRPKSSRPDADELAKEKIRGQQNMPPKLDFNDPKYQGEAGEKLKTLHMRMYQEQLKKYNEANNSGEGRISGLSQGGQKVDAIRPTAPLRPQTASSTPSSIGGAEAINLEGQESSSVDESTAAAAQLQMLRQQQQQQQQALASSSPSSSSSSSSSISVQSVRKPASQKKISTTKQRTKQITSRLIKLSGFAAAGIAYGRYQNEKERRKVQKGIEIYNTQKADFFNVTLDPDSDLSVDEQIKRARSNSTDTDDDDDDYDMDDDPDEDEPPTSKSNRGVSGGGKPPKKPSGGSGSTGGSSSSSPSSPSTSSYSSDENKKASDDDIERMKRLFDKD